MNESSEHLIPYISEKNHVLTVILVYIGNGNEALLVQRNKRPYKGKLGLPGGRLLLGENIAKAIERIVMEKCKVKAKFKEIKSVSLEHLIKNKKMVHSFMLILVSARVNKNIVLTNIHKNKGKIISSDYALIKKDLNKNTDVKIIKTKI